MKEEKVHPCKQCTKKFTQSSQLNRHMKSHIGEKPYECKQCGKKFTQSFSLKSHMRSHTGENLYQCKQCRKKYTQSSHLKQHIMRVHTAVKAYECSQCKKQFTESFDLTRHMRLHTGEKPYQCQHCGKKFSQSTSLKVHMRSHTGEKPYQCKQCGKKFTESSNLRSHMRLHTGEKPHQCEQCRKKFSRSSRLKEHMRLHTGEKPFQCKVCREKFATSANLKRHMSIHTQESLCQCRQCGKSFAQSGHLNVSFNTTSFFFHYIAKFVEPSMFTLQIISCNRTCSPSADYVILNHPNITVIYGVTPCCSMLVMEKVTTRLSNVLSQLGDEVTVRERVDICNGIVCAVDYLHHHVGIVHGYINVDNVFVTSRFTAKLLNPSAAFLMHDKMCQRTESFAHDLHHLVCLLISTLYDMYPAFISARDRLHDMISSEEIKKEREECVSTSVLLHILDELRDTDEYRDCSRNRELSYED